MLRIDNLCFSYSRGSRLIENLSMSVGEGVVCGLLGKNGAGKTTLLYLICGLLKPKAGSIDVNGFTPFDRNPDFLQDIFIVPEEFSLPNVTLDEFLKVNSPFYPDFNKKEMDRYLDIFELSGGLHLGRLSMGQKKKVFISFAMACNTSLLVLDEPTNGLDITAKRNFRRAVAACMSDRKSIIISTHQVNDVDKILDHVVITDRDGVLMNQSMTEIAEKYRFTFTTDKTRAENALISLDVPGGYNIVETLEDPSQETEVNLETLFELVQQQKRNIKK